LEEDEQVLTPFTILQLLWEEGWD